MIIKFREYESWTPIKARSRVKNGTFLKELINKCNKVFSPMNRTMISMAMGICIILAMPICPYRAFSADESLVVTESGNVGIGTTTPKAKLHVNGATILGSYFGATTFNVANYFTNEHGPCFIHIRLPLNPAIANDMFHIKVRGYGYYCSPRKIIDLTYVGYCYWEGNSLIETDILDITNSFEPFIYRGSDNFIYLRFSLSNSYYTSFGVDSMRVGSSNTTIKEGDVQITRTLKTVEKL